MPTLEGRELARNARIDTVRGAAILMVMLLHFGETYGIWDRGPLPALVGPFWAWSMLGWGNFAVTMFFVVSGFLIATNAAERAGSLGRIDLRAFYARRFARLAPTLLLALATVGALGLASVPSFAADAPHRTTALLLGIASVLGFVANLLMQRLGYFDYALNVYWSLSVEETFYIAFPLVCLALRRDRLIAIPCLLLVAIAPFYRGAHENDNILYLYADLSCFDAIAIGCIASMVARRWQPSRRFATVLAIAGWIVLVAFWLRGFGGTHKMFSFTAIALATAAIVLGDVAPTRPATSTATPPLRVLRWLGRRSYELYLFHIIVLGIMRDLVPGAALAMRWQVPWLSLFLVLSACVADVVARRVGDPANRRIRRLLRA